MEDIDDILAEVIGDDVIPTETRDLRRLTRAWVNERASPELMPYPQDVMERVMNRIRRQASRNFLLPFSSPSSSSSSYVVYPSHWEISTWCSSTRTDFSRRMMRMGVGRASRDGNWSGGSQDQFSTYHHPDRIGTIQVPGAILSKSSNRKGEIKIHSIF